jgi:signal peptidase I
LTYAFRPVDAPPLPTGFAAPTITAPVRSAGGGAAAARTLRAPASQTLARIGEELLAWFRTLVSAAVYATLIVTFGFQVARVEGQSMAPTLEDQDRLIVNKFAYRLHDPEVGDIVMLLYPEDPSKSFVKRVMGAPGDTLRIVDGRVFRNDVPLPDDYIPDEFRSHDQWGPQTLLRDGRPSEQQLRQPDVGHRPAEVHHRESADPMVADRPGPTVRRLGVVTRTDARSRRGTAPRRFGASPSS